MFIEIIRLYVIIELEGYLCIPDLNPFFILSTVCFEKQKFQILMESSILICSFMGHACGVVSKKYLPNQGPRGIL